MDRKYRVVSRAILATAMIVPAFIATKVAAENRGWNTSPYRSNYYNYGYNNWNGYNGYNSWTYSYGYGYPNWNYYYGYNYGYPSWNNYYGYNGWNYGYSLENDVNYIYWNGNHYYRMSDGTYRIYRNGEWKPLTNRNNSTNNLANDPPPLDSFPKHLRIVAERPRPRRRPHREPQTPREFRRAAAF